MILPSSKFRYLYYNRSPLHRSPLPFESGNPAKFGTAFLWIRYNGKGFSLGQRKMEEGGTALFIAEDAACRTAG